MAALFKSRQRKTSRRRMQQREKPLPQGVAEFFKIDEQKGNQQPLSERRKSDEFKEARRRLADK